MAYRSLLPVVALALALAACATEPKIVPPPVVATLPPPPPVMPEGGYVSMPSADKREDGTYVTPNFRMTPAAAVWHLRGAFNVAALACDQAGGGTVDPYNAFLRAHQATLDANVKQYMHEWQDTGWGDWQDAYDNNQTRLYNFYTQPAIRVAFCQTAREEFGRAATVTDAELPTYARAALARLDQPFITFYTNFDKWRAFYQPKVTPPPVVATLSDAVIVAAGEGAPVAPTPPAPAPEPAPEPAAAPNS